MCLGRCLPPDTAAVDRDHGVAVVGSGVFRLGSGVFGAIVTRPAALPTCGGWPKQGVGESAELVDGQREQACRWGCGVGSLRWPRPGRHGRAWPDGPAVPGGPAPDLILIEPETFGG